MNDGTQSTRTCTQCGKEFSPKQARSTVCSKNCQRLRWYYQHHEQANATTRAWQKRNAARWYVRKAAWGRANAAHKAEMYRAWISANPEAPERYAKVRIDRMRHNRDSIGISDRDWQKALNRSRGRCSYCEIRVGVRQLEMDHIIPLSRGGRHAIGNVTPVCHDCNQFKRAHMLMEWRLLQYEAAA